MMEENLVSLLNNFLKYYNGINKSSENMFCNVDLKDEKSTNEAMENFYDMISDYKENNKKNIPIIKHSDSENLATLSDSDSLYSLIVNDKTDSFCTDLFTLLLFVTSNKITNWKIETLR